MNSIIAIGIIALGSMGAASFYVPLKRVKKWSWETYWLVQGVFAWIIIPFIFAYFTVPEDSLTKIMSESPSSAKYMAVLFGMLWGVGGLTFGLSIRYLGIALGQSISLGFCAAFGTLIPPIVAGENLLTSSSGLLMLAGVSVCILGITIIGYAGTLKNKNLSAEEKRKSIKEFALKKGLIISVIAGIMSASFSYGFEVGKPIDAMAVKYGVNTLFQSNITLVFILAGGFITNMVYCLYLNIKNRTFNDYTSTPSNIYLKNLLFTSLAGLFWFLQFHFYGMGKSQLPENISAFSWNILMALNIAISNAWGIVLSEWKGSSKSTIVVLVVGIVVLILSTFVVG